MLKSLLSFLPTFTAALSSLKPRELVLATLWLATISVLAVVLTGCGGRLNLEALKVETEIEAPKSQEKITNAKTSENEP